MQKYKQDSPQRLSTNSDKRQLLAELDADVRKLSRIMARSDESKEVKEKLAKLLLFILNVIDIENERIKFDETKRDSGRVLPQD